MRKPKTKSPAYAEAQEIWRGPHYPTGPAERLEEAVQMVIRWAPARRSKADLRELNHLLNVAAQSFLGNRAKAETIVQRCPRDLRLRKIAKIFATAQKELGSLTWEEGEILNAHLRCHGTDVATELRKAMRLADAPSAASNDKTQITWCLEPAKTVLADWCWRVLSWEMDRAPGYSANSRVAQLSAKIYEYATGLRAGDSEFERTLDDLKLRHRLERDSQGTAPER